MLPTGDVIAVYIPGNIDGLHASDHSLLPKQCFIGRLAAQGYLAALDSSNKTPLEIRFKPESQKIECISDRMGQIPLYYKQSPGLCTISTSLEWIIAATGVRPQFDMKALYRYLFFHSIPAPSTIYQGIQRLDAAETLTLQIDKSTYSNHRNWIPEFKATKESQQELSEELFNCLKNTVMSDYRPNTGSFLSGGLDSSTITGMMCQFTEGKDAFSIGFPIPRYDETEYAQCAAEHFGASLSRYTVESRDIVDTLPKLIASLDQPFGNSSIVPAYFCAKLAKQQGIGHLLAGDGGDELFGGNERYRKQLLFQYYACMPKLSRDALEALMNLPLPRLKLIAKAKSYIDQARVPLPDRLHSYNLLHKIDLSAILSPEFLNQQTLTEDFNRQKKLYHSVDTDSLNRMLYLDWKYTLADNDLIKVNSMCALAGIEVSYPMLDDTMIDLSLRVPSKLKINGHQLRYLFKQSMSEFLPEKILNKPKHGFGLPYGYWLQDHKDLQDLTRSSISTLQSLGIFMSDLPDKVLTLNDGNHAHYYGELAWILMALGLWVSETQKSSGQNILPGANPGHNSYSHIKETS
ncbi:asparagine synthase C-terminal domain-containing protein [Aestuariirhabdus sp. Z084]|uniref:asparagine synthetase B family protein n=1 Tax=Aestuariirhabdus haliotis TaxID=2918751 RepID=UPI00201B3DAC|nr:asparagine synthase C-terminal domain-containing protein [Aestuariirhabdus haliotis]MCL6414694.1 asparagine synthase C-terminal domain-containing protein [Aestuariirhabdus haliotis]MCL6418626.1 asparagine synthase C-terminal domain-containing protein [Aestuariirhabdus haliotis]